jgi:hypothetical protein
MAGDDLTIFLFFFGTAISLAAAGTTTTGRRAYLLYGIGAAFLLLALFWKWVAAAFPLVSNVGGALAQNPVAWFCLLLFGAWLLTLRRRANVEHITANIGTEPAVTMDHIHSLAKLDTAMTQSLSQMRESFESRLSALEKSSREMNIEVKKLYVEVFEGTKDTLFAPSTTFGSLREEIEEFRREQAEAHETLAQSLRARRVYDEAKELHKEINWLASGLNWPMERAGSSEEWSKWEETFATFRSWLERFVSITESYHSEATNIRNTPSEKYKPGHWQLTDANFPDADKLHDFKTFIILKGNYDAVIGDILEHMYDEGTI